MQLKWLLFSLNIILFIYCTYQNLRVSLERYDKYTIKEEFFDSSSVYAYPLSLGYIFSCLITFFSMIYLIKNVKFILDSEIESFKFLLLLFFPILIFFIQGMYGKFSYENSKTYELEVIAIIFWVLELIWFFLLLFC